uniref:Uncharacterized protein n=1 Tax=uncultured marine virus TaxID=186617 RepID=A0A0F7LA14_9VIRU|nr:hypothetical protein [uncultured marine virus]
MYNISYSNPMKKSNSLRYSWLFSLQVVADKTSEVSSHFCVSVSGSIVPDDVCPSIHLYKTSV